MIETFTFRASQYRTLTVEGLDCDRECLVEISIPDGDVSTWLPEEEAHRLYETLGRMLGLVPS